MSQEQAKQKIGELIKKYEEVLKSGEVKKYTEEETKKGFIEPFFKALGWDISNKKEVSAEEHIKSSGRVDYGFYINGRTKFYLEAKPLKADLNDEDFAKQAIRYSWNRGVTWAVLTNFESVKVFNAQAISKYLGDKLYFEIPNSEFLERFDQLWQLSRDEFEHDLIDKEAERVGKKLQKVSITSLLYKDLNESREILTKGFTLWNKHLDKDLLDEGVQRLLDRLIFIRVAEDRGIEPPTLQPLLREWKAGPRKEPFFKSLISKFRELDATYNSNLFSPHPFEDWEEYDNVTEEAIGTFYGKPGYYEYDFKAIPADVLGTVYENYLGYRLAQSKKKLAIAKDAKKRKEQGIYYTPNFIVDYIVKNALGPVLDKCRSIDDLKKIKVLDPACGSGSFLIKAQDMIHDKYKEFNRNDPYVKIQILTENIYGVDLDEQAVEIARLNLLVNSLDGRIKLPSLSNNIKNGNSLISGTDEELKKYFGKDYRDKKPFNWQEEFPEVFKQGGFDVVIGNPPYVNAIQLGNVAGEDVKNFWKERFESAKKAYDIYVLFFEQSLKICKNTGYVAFITPNKYISSPYGEAVRKLITENYTIAKVLDLSSLKVFDSPSVYPIITIIYAMKPTKTYSFVVEKSLSDNLENKLESHVSSDILHMMPESLWGIILSRNIKTIEKIFSKSSPLEDVAEVNATSTAAEADEFSKYINGNKIGLPIINTGTIDRYSTTYGKANFKNKGTQTKKPFLDVSKIGIKRRNLYSSPKIIIAKLALRIEAFFDDGKFASINTNCIHSPKEDYSLEYITAILNSKLISFVYSETFSGLKMGGGYFQFQAPQLRVLPIVKATKLEQAKLVSLVNEMNNLGTKLNSAEENSNEWQKLKDEIAKTDRKIDEEVYKLYGLTPEEIKIVEK